MGMTDQVFGIAEGWEPNREELRVERSDRDGWDETGFEELFRSEQAQRAIRTCGRMGSN